MRRGSELWLALAAVAWSPPALAGSAVVVAVFPLEVDARAGVGAADAAGLNEHLHDRVAASGRFEVVPKGQVKDALRSQKKASYEACYADACQIEIGAAVAAAKSIAGSIKKLGSRCTVALRLFDLKKETNERAATRKTSCDVDGLVEGIEGAVGELAGAAAPPATAPRAEPTPRAASPGASKAEPTLGAEPGGAQAGPAPAEMPKLGHPGLRPLEGKLRAYFALPVTVKRRSMAKKLLKAKSLERKLEELERPVALRVAAGAMTGEVYAELARGIREAPLPPSLTEEQQALFRTELLTRAVAPQEKAASAFADARSRALEAGLTEEADAIAARAVALGLSRR